MKETLQQILNGRVLNETDAAAALRALLAGEAAPEQIAAFLAGVEMRGLGLAELRGFHRTLCDSGHTVDLREFDPVDVCGTGGDGKSTFNISTLTAFTLAGAGVKVAKHGNYSATSGCGSSDVLQFLGVAFSADERLLRRQIAAANITYLHAPLFQPALKAVASVRRAVGFRTFFNALGPLLNPARPRRQFIGVCAPALLRLYRYFLEDSGTDFMLVNARDGYDEISLTGLFDTATNYGTETYTPEDVGFETVPARELAGGESIAQAAEQFLNLLRGRGTPAQNAVVTANAAFALRVAKPESGLDECRALAAESLNSGAAWRCFETLKQLTTVL